MRFEPYEVPVAYSMVAHAQGLPLPDPCAFHDFLCLWAAFNNIYTTIANRSGRRASLQTSDDGVPKVRHVGNVEIPRVIFPKEREQIDLAFSQFAPDLRRDLILHESTSFFVYRTPRWQGKEVRKDGKGQKLNGVLNVGHTIDALNLVWSPINTESYEQYTQGNQSNDLRDILSRQILDVVYTVRNNLFHGGKRADDAYDVEVVVKAIPLLSMIVSSFLHESA